VSQKGRTNEAAGLIQAIQ